MTKSINNNGCSTCKQGKENYTTFIAGAFRGTEYYQYDYRHTNGKLFSCIARSLDECRKSEISGFYNFRFERTEKSVRLLFHDFLNGGKKVTKTI